MLAELTAAESASAWDDYLSRLEQWTKDTGQDPSTENPAPQPPRGETMPFRYAERAHQLLALMACSAERLTEDRDAAGRQLSKLRGLPPNGESGSGEARYLDRSA